MKMRVYPRCMLGLASLNLWAPYARTDKPYQVEVFSPMIPVKTASGVYSGKDLIMGTEEDEPSSTLHIRLMDESFGNSYGKPFAADLPSITISFDTIWIRVTVKSKGHQFDRLATVWIDNFEIMRLSTPEPTDQGVISYIIKDLSHLAPIFRNDPEDTDPKIFIYDMGNIIDSTYNAPVDVSVDAYFYQSIKQTNSSDEKSWTRSTQLATAHQIIHISASRGSSEGKPSAWYFPDEKAETKIRIPSNTARAVLTVAATGQGTDEFWWSNVPESGRRYYESIDSSSKLPGLSSFREVRVYVDGHEAGYAWPFPVIFTGGISPSLHRPVAGIQAYDLRESEIDLTPWIGLMSDGEEHSIRMEVWGVDDTGTSGPEFKHAPHHWLLSGKIFVWETEREEEEETGDIDKEEEEEEEKEEAQYEAFGPQKSIWGAERRAEHGQLSPQLTHTPINYKHTIKPLNDSSFEYTQSITRKIVAEAPSRGRQWRKGGKVKTVQEYQMRNTGVYKDYAQTQEVQSKYTGGSQSTHNGEKNLATRFTYEVSTVASSKSTNEIPLSLDATLSHKLHMAVTNHSPLAEGARDISGYWGDSAGTIVSTHKDGESTFRQWSNGATEGRGTTTQDYRISSMEPTGKDYIGAEGDAWYSREAQYNDNMPLLDKQYFRGDEVSLSPKSDEPVERQISLHSQDLALDYAPYPLTRSGLPWIYLRDHTAVESSSFLKAQRVSDPSRT